MGKIKNYFYYITWYRKSPLVFKELEDYQVRYDDCNHSNGKLSDTRRSFRKRGICHKNTKIMMDYSVIKLTYRKLTMSLIIVVITVVS